MGVDSQNFDRNLWDRNVLFILFFCVNKNRLQGFMDAFNCFCIEIPISKTGKAAILSANRSKMTFIPSKRAISEILSRCVSMTKSHVLFYLLVPSTNTDASIPLLDEYLAHQVSEITKMSLNLLLENIVFL